MFLRSMLRSHTLYLVMFFLCFYICSGKATSNPQPDSSGCRTGAAVGTDGMRRLALIVGVGEYKSPKVKDLAGPPSDARRFYELLTGRNGYGFQKLQAKPQGSEDKGFVCRWPVAGGRCPPSYLSSALARLAFPLPRPLLDLGNRRRTFFSSLCALCDFAALCEISEVTALVKAPSPRRG